MNSTELEIKCLEKMAIALDEKCSQNKKDIAIIFELIKDIKDSKDIKDIKDSKDIKDTIIEMSDEIHDEPITEEKIEKIESDMIDTTMDRRIAYHKEQSTYKEPELDTVSTITPLHTLTNSEREALEKKIFYDAVFNVETILDIKRSDPDFRRKVCEESDRLLTVWNEQHKSKNL